MRILADYHHADLYESLCILFEDRMGWEVYRPAGLGWHEQGLWKYSDNPAVARQFLETPLAGAVNAGPYYEFPEVPNPRKHRLVTVEQSRQLKWDFLLGSVTQHERLWSRLARDIGAKFIYQVGNIGQPVDWSLDPLVLCSSSLPIQGRGVYYHPEFSLKDYNFNDTTPAPQKIITNFMNCLPATSTPYQEWCKLQELLPDFTFLEYGILGKDGIVGPSSRIAEKMRASGWAYHSKPHGDGYGFVIHQWAAVGRPMIGRSAAYRPCVAHYFWERDGGPYPLDLDRTSIEEVAETIRRVTADPAEYARACQAANARFRDKVDFAAEAQRAQAFFEQHR